VRLKVLSTFEERDMTQTASAPRTAGNGAMAAPQDDDVARLVRAAGDGDQHAWNMLVDRYAGLVWSVIRSHRLGGADAADAAQTTWLRLVEHLNRLQEPARVGAWLATTARRECLRTLRNAGRQVPYGDELPEPEDDSAAVDAELLRSERDTELWEAFARLPHRDQSLLRMLVAEPAPSYREISCSLGIPIGSIGPTRARSLERLRRERELVLAGAAA
jgi:RNA polymerase sigma factor (sigma-70 family)